MAKIKIETGIKVYDIENERGEIIGQLKFNPSDINLHFRLEKFEQKCMEIQDYIQDALAKCENNSDIMKAVIAQADNDFKKEIDEVFGKGSSQNIFGVQNVFNSFEGKTYMQRFLEAIIPVVRADIEEYNSYKAKKIERYKEIIK